MGKLISYQISVFTLKQSLRNKKRYHDRFIYLSIYLLINLFIYSEYNGFWVYKMTTTVSLSVEEKECFNWYVDNKLRGVDVQLNRLRSWRRYQCPCSSRQLRFAPGFRVNRIDKKNNVICFASMTGPESAVRLKSNQFFFMK